MLKHPVHPIFVQFLTDSYRQFQKLTRRLLADQPFRPSQTQYANPKSRFRLFPPVTLIPSTDPNPNPTASFAQSDFNTLFTLLANPNQLPGPELEDTLSKTGIEASTSLLQALFSHFDSSPKPLISLFNWAAKQSRFKPTAEVFNSVINVLAKAREFELAWRLLIDFMERDDVTELVSVESFKILIRRYARAGMTSSAFRTYDFASNLDLINDSAAEITLFEILLDALCKEGHVRIASDYLDRKMKSEPNGVPSIRIYNILLNGWFRLRKLKQVERLWIQMKKDNVVPTVVTYGTLVEGYCRMRRVERAIELVAEMKKEGPEPNAVVYNPILDALAEAGRFKEALGMLEHLLVLESGPTLSTYNSLVKGFCKAGDLVGASRILKMMTNRGFNPTATTYNYIFRYFSKCGMVEEAMNLYSKIIDAGHNPDRLTFHLMIKMLCEQDRLTLAMQVSQEMRAKGCDMDLATSTMLVHLMIKLHIFKEAFAEFEDMIRRGIVPQYLTYQRLHNELRRSGNVEMAKKVSHMMASVPHSTNLPNTYVEDDDSSYLRRKSVMQRATAMSNVLKTCNDPRKLVKHRNSENVVGSANQLIEEIRIRFSEK